MKLDLTILDSYVSDGWVVKRKHPEFPLYIYNYTAKTQYERHWDDITIQCRGLILDEDGNIIARPFKKFFNLEELNSNDIPQLPFDAFDKLDGSLGILYFWDNKPYISTRGSFESDMAIHATNILYNKYQEVIPRLNPKNTYLFEILYPENQIVINYGGLDDIILLTVINTETAQETMENIGFPVVHKYNGITDINQINSLERDDKEGVVIRFQNNFRVKVKFAEYLRLHKIMYQFSDKMVWHYLSEHLPMNELLENVPDEFYRRVKDIELKLLTQFNDILSECKTVYKELDTIRETAEYFNKQKYPAVLFLMLKDRDPSPLIWKIIKPKQENKLLFVEKHGRHTQAN